MKPLALPHFCAFVELWLGDPCSGRRPLPYPSSNSMWGGCLHQDMALSRGERWTRSMNISIPKTRGEIQSNSSFFQGECVGKINSHKKPSCHNSEKAELKFQKAVTQALTKAACCQEQRAWFVPWEHHKSQGWSDQHCTCSIYKHFKHSCSKKRARSHLSMSKEGFTLANLMTNW